MKKLAIVLMSLIMTFTMGAAVFAADSTSAATSAAGVKIISRTLTAPQYKKLKTKIDYPVVTGMKNRKVMKAANAVLSKDAKSALKYGIAKAKAGKKWRTTSTYRIAYNQRNTLVVKFITRQQKNGKTVKVSKVTRRIDMNTGKVISYTGFLARTSTAMNTAGPVNISKGETAYVILDSNSTTGYDWTVESTNKNVVKVISKVYIEDKAAPGVTGTGGKTIIVVKGINSGSAVINAVYEQSWEKTSAAETNRYEINVN